MLSSEAALFVHEEHASMADMAIRGCLAFQLWGCIPGMISWPFPDHCCNDRSMKYQVGHMALNLQQRNW